MKMPTVMGHKFSEVPRAEIQRSQFDRSFGYKTTFDAGYLIPFYVDEALPGDTFHLQMTGFARVLSPMIRPIMDNMYLETFFFAVPYRLVWDNFVKFMGEQRNPGDSTSYVCPTISAAGGIAIGTLADYMGIPTGVAGTLTYQAMPFRAYNLIWNEWFRDQNMQNSAVVDVDDGPDNYSDYVLLRRGKRHDYFTSCLPWAQKGVAVSLPLGTTAPVTGTGTPTFRNTGGGNQGGRLVAGSTAEAPNVTVDSPTGSWTAGQLLEWQSPNLIADLTGATAATINQLRQAMATQRLLERDARGGTRYTEIVRAHFGVTSPDARLQRPEYLGGGSTPIVVSEVVQQSQTSGAAYQGNLAATGRAGFSGHGFIKSFTEHTWVIGMVCVRADLTYSQGMERYWFRSTRLEHYWGALSHIGEQAVLNREIFAVGTGADDTVFGYQERYAEYRYKPSKLTALMRVDAPGSLSTWHLSQDFTAAPTLNGAFIVEDPPVDRVIQVPAEPHFMMDSFTVLKCARPMPLYSVPGFMDRF